MSEAKEVEISSSVALQISTSLNFYSPCNKNYCRDFKKGNDIIHLHFKNIVTLSVKKRGEREEGE